jgi:hypothetical protein
MADKASYTDACLQGSNYKEQFSLVVARVAAEACLFVVICVERSIAGKLAFPKELTVTRSRAIVP